MKPSERINQLFNKQPYPGYAGAIAQFLDEQHEEKGEDKNTCHCTCQHEGFCSERHKHKEPVSERNADKKIGGEFREDQRIGGSFTDTERNALIDELIEEVEKFCITPDETIELLKSKKK